MGACADWCFFMNDKNGRGHVLHSVGAYFGTISVGSNSNGEVAQEFSVVFDTGSGHIVLPSETCDSQACHTHRRYDISSSNSAQAINADGTEVPANEPCDQVRISEGDGQLEFLSCWCSSLFMFCFPIVVRRVLSIHVIVSLSPRGEHRLRHWHHHRRARS